MVVIISKNVQCILNALEKRRLKSKLYQNFHWEKIVDDKNL